VAEVLRVLVVDDEPGIRLGATRVLQGFRVRLAEVEGDITFDVAQAASGEEALERIAAGPPDLLLLDHKLPGLQGLEVLDRLGQTQADLLTIMITAYATIETAVTATKRGAYDFLAKPFSPDELKATVSKAAKQLILQREARRLAQEKRQVRFQFISVLAHELKAPLAAVEGFLDLLKSRVVEQDSPKYDDILGRSSVRLAGMRKLINDLLDLTRIESGQKRRELSPVEVREVARKVMETMAPAAAERGIAIHLHAEEPVSLHADAGELEIILNNLVSNGIKYNRDHGRVDITLSSASGCVTIAVADTGIGMTSEETGLLFKEFSRIKNTKTRTILGSGLGLSIVKKLAQLYGGNAWVESTPDVGSIFSVTLNDPGFGDPADSADPGSDG